MIQQIIKLILKKVNKFIIAERSIEHLNAVREYELNLVVDKLPSNGGFLN